VGAILIEHLVVSADSVIGAALAEKLNAASTTRRYPPNGKWFYDLRYPDGTTIPPAGITYFCSGINGFKACEEDPDAWKINVIGTVRAAERQVINGGKVVLLSSCASETHPDTLYGGYKLATEAGFRKFGEAASIFRFGPVKFPGRNTYPNGDYQPIEVDALIGRLTAPFSPGLHRVLS
jgi:nucleoside-diphosphate-sugar epimerase